MSPVMIVHVIGGTIGFASGATALFARKGSPIHRAAGNVFFLSMAVMAITAFWLAWLKHDGGLMMGGAFTLYLVATAWTTVRRGEGHIGIFEYLALAFILACLAGYAVLLEQASQGHAHAKGAQFIAFYSVAGLVALSAVLDVKVIVKRGISGTQRLARHIWRMCTALLFATGSFFTNGLPRILPGPAHVPPVYLAPMLIPLILMIFWLIRIRFPGGPLAKSAAS